MRALQASRLKSGQQGVVLLETLIAILIFSLAVLALVGLQAAMVKNAADSKYRADASFIAQAMIGAMWADPANITSGDFVKTNFDLSNSLPNLPTPVNGQSLPRGLLTVTSPVNGQFTVTVGWTAPGETPAAGNAAPCFMPAAHCFRTFVSIAGG